jgi:hypothetical protein
MSHTWTNGPILKGDVPVENEIDIKNVNCIDCKNREHVGMDDYTKKPIGQCRKIYPPLITLVNEDFGCKYFEKRMEE